MPVEVAEEERVSLLGQFRHPAGLGVGQRNEVRR